MPYYDSYDDIHFALIDSVKQALFNRHEDIFERLDFEEDAIFDEPLLYTYLKQSDNKWLDAIIYGYEKEKKPEIEVFSNARGIIYLPNTGYFKTNAPHKTLLLQTDDHGWRLLLDGQPLDYIFEPILILDDGIEIIKHQHPLIESVFAAQGTPEKDIAIDDVYSAHLASFDRGLAIIRECNPPLFHLLGKSLKKAMLFASEKQYSFATFSMHNMIFLNVHPWDTELFFTDHISHEGSHVIFFTLTFESKQQLFKCDPNTPFSVVTGIEWQHSTIYLRFHGLFTYMEITRCLLNSVQKGLLPDDLAHEAKGRLVFYMLKFRLSLQQFEELDICKEEGLYWLRMFRDSYNHCETAYETWKDLYKLEKQPYDFNKQIFIEENTFYFK